MIIKLLAQIDWVLLGLLALILLISTVTLFSLYWKDTGLVAEALLIKHIISIILGLSLAIIIAQFDYRILPTIIRPSFLILIVILTSVLIFGTRVKGATSWFVLSGFSFQPSELAKVVIILIIAQYFSRYYRKLYGFWTIIISAIPVWFLIFLVLMQPDFGTASILFLIWLGMVVFGGIRFNHLIIILVMMAISGLFFWNWVLKDYQQQRIITFLNPAADPLGSGYNTIQLLKSVKAGDFWGNTGAYVGVPEIHTDFIFSGLAQQWGFVGVGVYSLLLLAFLTRLLYHISKSQDIFARMILLGVIIAIWTQSSMNIAMNLGLLPITGITLPFMSYGGSSMLASWIMIGLALSVIRHKQSKTTLPIRDSQDIFG